LRGEEVYDIMFSIKWEKVKKMKKLLFSLLLLFVLVPPVSAQIESIEFSLPEEESSANPYQLEPYYFLHYLYTDVLYFFGLLDELDLPAKTEIFTKLFNNMGAGHPVGVVIKLAGHDEPLRVSYRVFADGDMLLVYMTTNYDYQKEEILKRFTWECYSQLYYIAGDKLVNDNYIYSEEKEEIYKVNLNNLADLYIFDERAGNDHLIEELLLEYINSSYSATSKLVGNLTLAQYYMVMNELEKAQESLAEAEALFADLEGRDKKDWRVPLLITREELQIIMGLYP
jgi:hypothetical protein